MARYEQMSLVGFQKQFSTHEACHDHLFKLKWWAHGYRCEKCDNDSCFETITRKHKFFECKRCCYQATVTVKLLWKKRERT